MICDQHTCARCGKNLFQNESEKWNFDTKWDLIQIMLWDPDGKILVNGITLVCVKNVE